MFTLFQSTRVKLTLWYLLIIMCITISFSAVMYRVLIEEVNRFELSQRIYLRRKLPENILNPQFSTPYVSLTDPEVIDQIRHRIFLTLVGINIGIFSFSAVLGYVLAGRTLQPIKSMVDEQNRFISDASHELRTPLTSLKIAMEVFLRDKQATLNESKELVKESIDEVNKLQTLSDNLLQLVRHQPQTVSQHLYDSQSTEKLVTSALKKIEPMAKQKEIEIHYSGNDYQVYGNAEQLTDTLIILLDNAIKYSQKGSSIEISVMKRDKMAQVQVVDHGVGIEPEALPHIFDRFFRADTARKSQKSGGFGLGLSIAQKIMEEHHGSISVKSKLEQGSSFILHIPLA